MVKTDIETGAHAVTPMEPPAAIPHMIMVIGLVLLGGVLLSQFISSIRAVIKREEEEIDEAAAEGM